mgnify:CR=1 FL=1
MLDLALPRVMGILNVTPDSFFDGGRHDDPDRAVERGRMLAAEGADIVDVGGESTRPGARAVDASVEIARVVPVVEALAAEGIPVSVDTSKPEVMRAALAAGASMVNDVRALLEPGAMEVVASSGAAVCLMHMRGTPETMQVETAYADVVAEVRDFLARRAAACERAGIARNRIVVAPGFGFGKGVAETLALLRRLRDLVAAGYPVLAGLSRKSTIGAITGRSPGARLAGSLAAALTAVARGAALVRVHDVREAVDALRVYAAAAAVTDDSPGGRGEAHNRAGKGGTGGG